MSEQVWYIFQHAKQDGPFSQQRILEMLDTHMIAQDAYLFKAGWKDWLPLVQCYAELGRTPLAKPDVAAIEDGKAQVKRAPRATIRGRIIVHNNGKLIIGAGVNISASGIFIETPDPIFKIGEQLKLTCRVDGFLKAFNAEAMVVRFNQEAGSPIGYGLHFIALEEKFSKEIQKLIDQENALMNFNQTAV